MSSDSNTPPKITPKVDAPRPDLTSRSTAQAAPPPPPPASGDATSAAAEMKVEHPASSTPVDVADSKASGARAGAMKAAAAAIAAAKSAARKVSTVLPAADDMPATASEAAANAPEGTAALASEPATVSASSTTSVPTSSGGRQAQETLVQPVAAGATAASGSSPATATISSMHYAAPAGLTGTATLTSKTSNPGGHQMPVEPGAPAPHGATHTGANPVVRPQDPGVPRRVRLAVSRIDPWSVMKLSFLLAFGIGIMTVVAAAVFWQILDSMQVFAKVETFLQQIAGSESNVNILQFVAFPRVVSVAAIIAVVNVVLLTALSTIMAFLYNITTALVGGVHLTLTDD